MSPVIIGKEREKCSLNGRACGKKIAEHHEFGSHPVMNVRPQSPHAPSYGGLGNDSHRISMP